MLYHLVRLAVFSAAVQAVAPFSIVRLNDGDPLAIPSQTKQCSLTICNDKFNTIRHALRAENSAQAAESLVTDLRLADLRFNLEENQLQTRINSFDNKTRRHYSFKSTRPSATRPAPARTPQRKQAASSASRKQAKPGKLSANKPASNPRKPLPRSGTRRHAPIKAAAPPNTQSRRLTVCRTHKVVSGEACFSIANANRITVSALERYNQYTWGWTGCNGLQLGMKLCVSPGEPAMPTADSGAICGPTVPGSTAFPGASLSLLNQCPLNSCCSRWGRCGTTAEFCGSSVQPLSLTGTGPCLSNCGMKPILSSKPATFINVGYYHALDGPRPCLNMNITRIQSGYTHIHFAFAQIGERYNISTAGVQSAFKDFVSLKGVKRVVSIGGGDGQSLPISRRGYDSTKRTLLARNIAAFVRDNKLDGIDIDWEFPASAAEGKEYLAVLQEVRRNLQKGATLSIAAPAGYDKLRFYPIREMSVTLDYIVYMTYDLHGQWDYGNKWSSPGCPGGNCLRSHVNSTEIYNSITMITKAGIPSNKVVMGVASYGRSFRMTKTGCASAMCPFAGPKSLAKPGRCTGIAGFLANAEITEILRDPKRKAVQYFDKESDSDLMVYDSLEWVAHLSQDTIKRRIAQYKSMNLGGTALWAVDLLNFV